MHTIEELSHFGRFFIKTVPEAIIRLQKWSGDITPIAVMDEAWFRIKGIPMKYRNKSTAFYVASMVGKPLALDKNFLRNVSYIRVRIGCQDTSLIPNTRIGEIKKEYYEFQFTKELFDPSTNPAEQHAITAGNTDGGVQQGSPKRQRTDIQDNTNTGNNVTPNLNNNPPQGNGGSIQQCMASNVNERGSDNAADKGKQVVVSSSQTSSESSFSFGAKVNSYFEKVDQNGGDQLQSTDIAGCSNQANAGQSPLREVHREVIGALIQELPGVDPSLNPGSSSSFASFVQTLANSSSDKVYSLRKKYNVELGPILEDHVMEDAAQSDEENPEEQVDYSSSSADGENDFPRDEDGYIHPSRVVLALHAPSLESEDVPVVIPVDGAQPEVDSTQEDISSQPETVNNGDGARNSEAGLGAAQAVRASSRLAAQQNTHVRVEDRARNNTAARNLEGTNLTSVNSFAVLADDAVHNRMLEMGVDSSTFTLDNINCLKDLEVARHNIDCKRNTVGANDEIDSEKVGLLGWGEDGEEIEDFTPVISKKNRKKLRSACKVALNRGMQSSSGMPSGGAQTKMSAASVKAHIYHPLSGIVTGTRERKKTFRFT